MSFNEELNRLRKITFCICLFLLVILVITFFVGFLGFRDLIFSCVFILVIFYKFINVGHESILVFLSFMLLAGCLFNIYEGTVNCNLIQVFIPMLALFILIFPFNFRNNIH